ncbi:PTS galactitol transporter subunit IIC [Clostridium guangxiense]|uniref:PTS galactitol transporter subunit IIC n=1 Tax=Clostridium guangxiense TaxID=1662055 RepID=UPI001E348DDC|nr:PTS transporter subunit IIC [Clostridium guangxiense]MCD2345489.1 PTS galactitol transporter subunit IIC [Clostridium guangxiense]
MAVINYILGLGAAVFLPIIMIILGLAMRMKPKKAIIAGLTLGIEFTGMNVVLGFMFNAISPAATAFVNNTGIKLTSIDVGWSPMSAIAWAWPYALLVFPLQIGINIVMLAFKWTDCLNVDLWNVWGKIFTATMVAAVTHSVPLGFVAAAIQVVLELKSADISQKELYRITKIPGVACSHYMTIQAALLAPINRVLDFIPGINKVNINAEQLKAKIGVFGENSVMGFIVGALIAAFGGYDLKGILTTAMEVATALVLFPMVAKLFMQALAPIADATSAVMKKRFKGREIYIGLDWPFLAGQSEIWVGAILLVPVELVLAVVMSKMGLNNVIPLAGVINVIVFVPALIVTGGNLIRMIILGLVATPIYLAVATSFSPIVTNLAKSVGTIKVPAGQYITYFGVEMPELRWLLAHGFNVLRGEIIPAVLLVGYFGLFYWYSRYMKKRDEAAEAKEAK